MKTSTIYSIIGAIITVAVTGLLTMNLLTIVLISVIGAIIGHTYGNFINSLHKSVITDVKAGYSAFKSSRNSRTEK